ncbi:hypothetical protein AB0I45_13145 [Brevibacterium sp. NPDC049920]|uniref:hypothetical protein n=1 Tax=Brevibacterium sp. NPDC049920 TaxID=3155279 RepID=UPI0033F95D09
MSSSVTVTPRTHWINGWFLRIFARPVVIVDDVEHRAGWDRALRVDVAAGRHRVAVGACYRGTSSIVGAEESSLEVDHGQVIAVEAKNGVFNHHPFTVAVVPR